jgi:homocysteine S-methyltransferase
MKYVTDGGLETDLIFNRGIHLREFSAFPLLETDVGRAALREYFTDYVEIAARVGAGLLLETPTWMANADRAAPLGYDPRALDRINRHSVELLREIGAESGLAEWQVGGIIGPRRDGYRTAGSVDPDQAAEYHLPQLASFAAAGAHRATALTLNETGEAIGVARAAAHLGLQLTVGFTVETDGRLLNGMTLAEAINTVDAAAPPHSFMINCAHPTHILASLEPGPWQARIQGLRVNASPMSHAELDRAERLETGDPRRLAADQRPLLDAFTNLEVLGGCCGTDARHVAAMWQVA